jgi:predicted TPR repeat methyltransferase
MTDDEQRGAAGGGDPAEHSMSLDEAMALAVQVHRSGRFAEARVIYEAVLKAIPEHPDALHFLGVLLHQQGEGERAAALIRRAVAVRPDYADAHNNLGNVLKEMDDPGAAAAAYREALRLQPDHAGAWSNLGASLKAQGLLEDAVEAFRRAIALAPDMVDAHYNLGNAYDALERRQEAAEAYERVLALAPEHADAHFRLGRVLSAMGRRDEALAAYQRAAALDAKHAAAHCNVGHMLQRKGLFQYAVDAYDRALRLEGKPQEALDGKVRALYRDGRLQEAAAVTRRWIEVAPDSPVPRHLLPALTGEDVPPRAADPYIRLVFDQFAANFDHHLEQLDYRAPQLVAEAVAVNMAPDARLAVLDAGCGTGLCGPLLHPYASRMTGVDLSPGMLAKARARGVYDELAEAELTGWLHAQPPAGYDVAVCADTLCYFGDLHQVLAGMRHVLRPGGLLVFTVESADAEPPAQGFCIHPPGRYSHTSAHIEQALATAGIKLVRLDTQVLRKESGAPVQGLVVTATAG